MRNHARNVRSLIFLQAGFVGFSLFLRVCRCKRQFEKLGWTLLGWSMRAPFEVEHECSFWDGPAVTAQGSPKFPLPCATICCSSLVFDSTPGFVRGLLL